MHKFKRYSLLRTILLSFGIFLLVILTTYKNIRFTLTQTETLLGALTALGIALFFLWKAGNKRKEEIKKS